MDWTGGIRKRYATNRSNSLLQKQKAHFAKARANLQITPTRHSGLDSGDCDAKIGPVSDMGGHHDGSRRPYLNAANVTTGRGSVPISGGHDKARKTIFGAHESNISAPSNEQPYLRAKKKQLLARGDWLGLKAARPVQLCFSDHKDKRLVAKRRKLSIANQTRLVEMHIAPSHGSLDLTDDWRTRPINRVISPQDGIDIKIGTGAFTSQACHTRPSDHGATSLRDRRASAESISDDTMLLDADHGSSSSVVCSSRPLPDSRASVEASLARSSDEHSLIVQDILSQESPESPSRDHSQSPTQPLCKLTSTEESEEGKDGRDERDRAIRNLSRSVSHTVNDTNLDAQVQSEWRRLIDARVSSPIAHSSTASLSSSDRPDNPDMLGTMSPNIQPYHNQSWVVPFSLQEHHTALAEQMIVASERRPALPTTRVPDAPPRVHIHQKALTSHSKKPDDLWRDLVIGSQYSDNDTQHSGSLSVNVTSGQDSYASANLFHRYESTHLDVSRKQC